MQRNPQYLYKIGQKIGGGTVVSRHKGSTGPHSHVNMYHIRTPKGVKVVSEKALAGAKRNPRVADIPTKIPISMPKNIKGTALRYEIDKRRRYLAARKWKSKEAQVSFVISYAKGAYKVFKRSDGKAYFVRGYLDIWKAKTFKEAIKIIAMDMELLKLLRLAEIRSWEKEGLFK